MKKQTIYCSLVAIRWGLSKRDRPWQQARARVGKWETDRHTDRRVCVCVWAGVEHRRDRHLGTTNNIPNYCNIQRKIDPERAFTVNTPTTVSRGHRYHTLQRFSTFQGLTGTARVHQYPRLRLPLGPSQNLPCTRRDQETGERRKAGWFRSRSAIKLRVEKRKKGWKGGKSGQINRCTLWNAPPGNML